MSQKIKILIVEDEFMIAEDIAFRLEDMGYKVIGTASTYDEGIILLQNNQVDLALLDICIDGEKDGIDLASIIQNKYQIPFIFLSSQSNHASIDRAKTVHPSAYLLKPFNDRQVQVSIELALDNFNKQEYAINPANEIKEIKNPPLKLKRQDQGLFFKKDTQFVRIMLDDILWFEAENNYTIVQTTNSKFVYATNLKQFENKLPADIFIRVHRSFIINIGKITGFEVGSIYIGTHRIPISRNAKDELLKNFNIL